MTSRVARLWQPGNPQKRVFLPDFWMACVEVPPVGRNKLPKNCVKFEVDPRMSRHDVREYLTKIYELPVRDVRTEVQMGEIEWTTPKDFRYKKATWRDNDKKFAYVFLSKGFEFVYPKIFEGDEDLKEMEKFKNQEKNFEKNAKFVNRDRKEVGRLFGI